MTDSLLAYKRQDLSVLDYTIDLLTVLSDRELEAIQSVAIAFLNSKNDITDETQIGANIVPFTPQTEEQLLTRIDHSIGQIKSGNYQDAEEVENELLTGIES